MSGSKWSARSFGLRVGVAVLALSAWGAAHGQLSGKGEVRGTVTDPQGAVVPGATVVATKLDTGVATTTTTTSSGDYSFPALDPGEYKVVVSATGFTKLEQQHVQVNALESITVSPHLAIGSTEVVTVSTEAPQLETSNATLGATLEHEMYEALPIEMGAYGQPDQRRATDFAFLMPGVQGNNTTGNPTTNAGIVNGSGSRGGVTAIYVDGVVFVRAGGNGDPRFVWTALSVDAIDQFQLQTNGYSAIYEGQGIQNYTIKTGGNKYHGAIYEFFRNTALDTWGYFGANTTNPYTGKPAKPIEHSNEYGINLSGPLLPFGSWREKLFAFANYNGFRYASQTPTQITLPTANERAGNFAGVAAIYDPSTAASCAAHNGGFPCRYRYGYGPGAVTTQSTSNPGNAILTGAAVDQIPAGQFSNVALNLQSLLPPTTTALNLLNYVGANSTKLNNWSTTERIDYVMSPKDTLTFVAAIGRQASSYPVGQQTAGRNIGPVPYNYGQAYAPKTAVGIVEETHTFTPHLINQIKYGFARYNGPTFNADQGDAISAAGLGKISGLPAGQAAGAFPIVTFTGNSAPTQWAGTTANVVIAQNFTLVDNIQYQKGNHSITAGAQIAWMQYLNRPATGGTAPITLATTNNATGQYQQTLGQSNLGIASGTGSPYASFLIGQIGSSTLTSYLVQEFSSRFRAISPYVQDTWHVTSRLTLDLGLRWDYFPPVRENVDNMSFFSPNVANPITGLNGGLQFAGTGANTCNCDTPINTYWKNFGPRVGFAFQSDDKTVWRGSYGVMFTHGNAVGGGTPSQTGAANLALGFSSTTTTGTNSDGTAQLTFPTTSTAYTPVVIAASGRNSGAQFGTGNTKTAGYTSTSPSSMAYLDPYTGSRAPEYINWSFGMQRAWTKFLTTTMSYVGSQGHFIYPDSLNARGYYANQLDPQYLSLNSALTNSGTTLTTYCTAHPGVCPAGPLAVANSATPLSTLLKPFPFQGVSDATGNVGNANYNALQASANYRASSLLTFMVNYTWSRSIDNAGTYRTGYAIPQQYSNTDQSWAPTRIERSVSTSNQPHHFVATGVWNLPFGRSIAAHNAVERAVFGGFKLSTIFQAFSGSPLAITATSCNPNPAVSQCMPNYNPNYPLFKNVRINGKYGQNINRLTAGSTPYIDINAFQYAPSYTFGNLSRTAPYNLYGPGNYQWDLSLRRSFKLHLTESTRFDFQADLYNVTNKTFFAISSTSQQYFTGNTAFGALTTNGNYNRRAAQFTARLAF